MHMKGESWWLHINIPSNKTVTELHKLPRRTGRAGTWSLEGRGAPEGNPREGGSQAGGQAGHRLPRRMLVTLGGDLRTGEEKPSELAEVVLR